MTISLHFAVALLIGVAFGSLPTNVRGYGFLHGIGAGVRYLLWFFWSLDTLATCFQDAARWSASKGRHLRLLGRHILMIDSRRRRTPPLTRFGFACSSSPTHFNREIEGSACTSCGSLGWGRRRELNRRLVSMPVMFGHGRLAESRGHRQYPCRFRAVVIIYRSAAAIGMTYGLLFRMRRRLLETPSHGGACSV